MATAEPPLGSFDRLARAALAAPSWPADQSVKERSLAAILGKLDRGADLLWLADRPAVQAALAEALGCPLADVRTGVEPVSATQAGRRLRLDDARYGRALDLLEEPLCPGIPDAVFAPARWSHLWWLAPGGSGRTLSGAWLAARGLASFVSARDWEAAATRLPATGAVFVELWGEAPGPIPSRIAELGRVCVASSAAPDSGDWQLLRSPAVDDFVEPLAAWLAARLPPDSAFDARRAVDWLRRGPIADGLVDTLGTALGLLAALDELEIADPRQKTPRELALAVMRSRLDAAADRGGMNAGWLRRSAFEVLVNLGRQLLSESDRPWDAPRSYDEWLDLVPSEHRRGPDLEWLRLSVEHLGGKLRASDIEQTAQRLPPGAFRILRAFQGAGVFVAGPEPDTFVLRPRWLGRTLIAEAATELTVGSPFEWGEALLRPAAPAVVARVFERLRADDGVLGGALELGADDSPAYVGALEVLVRGAGIALLGGSELAHEDLEALWNEQARVLFDLGPAPPRPRVEFPEALVAQEPALARGIWLLGALAVTEQLPAAGGERHPLLRPWLARRPPAGLRGVLDAIALSLELESARAAFELPALVLVDRLRNVVGSVAEDGQGVHPLELPGVLLDEVAHGVLDWSNVKQLERDPRRFAALSALAERRGVTAAELAQAVWGAWDAAGRPKTSLFTASGPGAVLFTHAPGRLLEVLLPELDARELAALASRFGEEQWQALARAASAGTLAPRSLTAICAAIDHEHAERLLALPTFDDPEALAALWTRVPGSVAAALRTRLDRDGTGGPRVLESAPPEQTAAAVDVLRRRLLASGAPELAPEALERVRRWLHARIASRAPAWREAYALLAELERRLAPVLRARYSADR